MLWLVFAGLTALAVLSILWPLVKRPRGSSPRAFEVEVYAAQVTEIDRDAAQGLVGPDEAKGAKAEAARRLIAATEGPAKDLGRPSRWRAWVAASTAVLLVPALALGLYGWLGHPDFPDAPLAARRDAELARTDLASAIARIEAHLKEHPDDGRGYEVLAPAYLRMGRGHEAVLAYAEALRILGGTAERHANLGEALVIVADGVVTEDATRHFEAAYAQDPSAKKSRFYLGLAAEQAGDTSRARDYWAKLAAEEPPNSALGDALRQRLAGLGGAVEPPQAGPAAAIAALPEAEQGKAIRAMVDRLAERLSRDGHDIEGWLRLVRAYAVLKDVDLARKAVLDAKRNLAEDATAIARIDALARELGLEG